MFYYQYGLAPDAVSGPLPKCLKQQNVCMWWKYGRDIFIKKKSSFTLHEYKLLEYQFSDVFQLSIYVHEHDWK